MPRFNIKKTDDYKNMPKIQQLWVDLSMAMNDVKDGESILKKRAIHPLDSEDPKVRTAWENLTSPENYEDLKKWFEPEGMNPVARKISKEALKYCEKKIAEQP